MIDWSIWIRKVTQGQPPAEMSLPAATSAQPPSITAPSTAPQQTGATASPPAEAPVDIQALAARVYELMRQDLVVERERRGW